MKFETEKDYEDYLEQLLKSNGWEVARQQPSDETIHWNNPYTLDLMIRKEGVLNNEWIGLELKNFFGISKGGEFWKVIKQIKKYTKLYFKGSKIKYWCVALPYNNVKYSFCNNIENNRILVFIKSFINSLGIGFLQNKTIQFCTNNGKGIIDIEEEDFPHETNKDFIDNIINNLNEWDTKFIPPEIDPWKDNRKCVGCGGCLDVEEIKFKNSCPYCGETVFDNSRTRGL